MSAGLFWTGIAIVLAATLSDNKNALLNWNNTYNVTEENFGSENLAQSEIDITEEKAYMIVAVGSANQTDISFKIYDENGEAVLEKSATGYLIVSQSLNLKKGHYKIVFEADEDIIGKQFTYQVMIR